MTYKLHKSEYVLNDDYPVVFGYVYIVDNVFTRCENEAIGTVGGWKKLSRCKEIRRCELFAHQGARLGDRVE